MKKRILTVDDDPVIRMLVRDMLESAQFEVVAATDGYEALKIIEQEAKPLSYCAIILDVEMPGMSGLDLLTRLKLHAETEALPVVMLTCQSSPDDVMSGYNVGASYYITKPFTREQLLYGLQLVGVS